MHLTFNHPRLIERRRELRANQTDSEKLLWSRLRGKQLNGLKFWRQYSIGPYIVDFYCPTQRLVVEVDGSQHMEKEQKEYDDERTASFNAMNIRVIRFWSNEVLNNIDGVLARIEEAVSPSNSP